MSSREEERKRLLQACMAVVKKEDSHARRRQEEREKIDRKKKSKANSSVTDKESFSLTSSISKPSSSISTSTIPKVTPAMKYKSTKGESRKSTPTPESKRKSSGEAGRRQKQALVKSKSAKSRSMTASSVSEVNREVSNTLNNVPESLQPVSESTDNLLEDLIDQVEEVETDGSSKITSAGSLSIKSILRTISSTHTLPTTEPKSNESVLEASETSDAPEEIIKSSAISDDTEPTSSVPDNTSSEKQSSGTVTKLSSALEKESSSSSSKKQNTSKSLSNSKFLPSSSNTLAPQAEQAAKIPNASPRSTPVEVYSEVFLSGATETSKRTPSALPPGSFISSPGQSQTVKSSRYQQILSRNEKYHAENASPPVTKAKKKQPASLTPKGKEKRSMSLKEIVLEEKKKLDERKQRSKKHAKEATEDQLLPFQEAEPSKGFLSALKSQLSSIEQNFVAVTDAENPPIAFSDKFNRENLILGKKEPMRLPKYDIPLPDIEHPYIPPRPFTDCAPGIEYTPIPQRPVIHEPYYGQPFYDPSGRVLEPEEITPVRKFVGDVLTSNERVITAAIVAAQQLGEFDEPRKPHLKTKAKFRKPPLQIVRMTNTDLDSMILEAEEEEEEFQRQTRSKMELKRLAAERERLERREERRERERGPILEVDPEELNYEHKRLEKDRERRVRERERLTRARERWEYERMDHERKRQEREENLAREKKAEADAIAARRKEEKDAIAARKKEEEAFANPRYRRQLKYSRR